MQPEAKKKGGRPRRKDRPKKTTILLANKLRQRGFDIAMNSGKSLGRLVEDLIAKEDRRRAASLKRNSNKMASEP